jgi:hypothetical protein
VSAVDELFGGDGGPPPPPPTRSLRPIWLAGVVLTLVGPCCFTGVPGAVLLVVARYRAEDAVARREAGALDATSERATLHAVNRWLGIACVLMLLQILAFGSGVYALIFASAFGVPA